MWMFDKVIIGQVRIFKVYFFYIFCQKLFEDVVWLNEGVKNNQEDMDIGNWKIKDVRMFLDMGYNVRGLKM